MCKHVSQVPSEDEILKTRFYLMTNGLRFIERGCDDYENTEYGFCVVNVAMGVEIVLKALVFALNWRYIARNRDISWTAVSGGEFTSIRLKEAFDYLFEFPPTLEVSQMIRVFIDLSINRNKAVHFYHPGLDVQSERRTVAITLARALHAVLGLVTSANSGALFWTFEKQISSIRAKLLRVDAFLDDVASSISTRLTANEVKRLIQCEACRRDTVINGTCLLCGLDNPDHHDIRHGAEPLEASCCENCCEFSMYPVRNGSETRSCRKCGYVERKSK